MAKNKYRIGIVGGMGPMAGVMLQQLIIKYTPAQKDQDHLQVLCFTNPQIPDRTTSLQQDNGKEFSAAIIKSVKTLEKAGIDCVLLPCNTAHARLQDIQRATRVPIVSTIEVVLGKIRQADINSVGVLATDGAIASRVFKSDKNLRVILPDAHMQQEVMDIIYTIKQGNYADSQIAQRIDVVGAALQQQGAQKVILGCTELSLYFPLLEGGNFVDSLSELAKEAVKIATAA